MPEQKKDKLNIRLHIYDEEVGVKIDREDEEYFRLAAKLITERYNAYAQALKGRMNDHSIALRVLLDISVMYEKELKNNDTLPYDNVLAQLTKEIEDALKENK